MNITYKLKYGVLFLGYYLFHVKNKWLINEMRQEPREDIISVRKKMYAEIDHHLLCKR